MPHNIYQRENYLKDISSLAHRHSIISSPVQNDVPGPHPACPLPCFDIGSWGPMRKVGILNPARVYTRMLLRSLAMTSPNIFSWEPSVFCGINLYLILLPRIVGLLQSNWSAFTTSTVNCITDQISLYPRAARKLLSKSVIFQQGYRSNNMYFLPHSCFMSPSLFFPSSTEFLKLSCVSQSPACCLRLF